MNLSDQLAAIKSRVEKATPARIITLVSKENLDYLSNAHTDLKKLIEAVEILAAALGCTWPNMPLEMREHHKEALQKVEEILK